MNKPTKEFLNYLQFGKNCTEDTIDSYRRDIEKFFKFLFKEDINMDEVDQIVIRNFFTEEITSGVSKRSCKRRLTALRQFYKFLAREGYIKCKTAQFKLDDLFLNDIMKGIDENDPRL